ncbi:MAG: acylneuraminate cytidylyltransferase family protein [Candidatus Koribacter versatilis]|uniref:Acylneuraminate cytidylyltransferase family protein n=1 Tax=Candidatus Korobacter versatilis TaxID=658062 RepID=A0A932A756_9BACT|nr:acylneuraminate cytidylyltransferase family protein [Candidatus Koribacter versatilis]
MSGRLLAVIPARGGSKGLPGKNIRSLAGVPLLVHAIELARHSPEVTDTLISTDSDEIAEVARSAGAEVPFLRPEELARDDTPTLPVLQHAVRWHEEAIGKRVDSVLLLQPTGPLRLPEDIRAAVHALAADPQAVGAIAVSEMPFHPRYVCAEDDGRGYLRRAFPDAPQVTRRQDLPAIYRINGMLYLWRRDYLMSVSAIDLKTAPHRTLLLPKERAIDIDDEYDFRLAEWTLASGLVTLPWLTEKPLAAPRAVSVSSRTPAP